VTKPHRQLSLALLGAALSLSASACTAALDFDDQCEVDLDCNTIARGLRCELGFCVPRDLVEPLPCEGCPPSSRCDRLYGEDPRKAAPGTVITIGTLLPRSGALGAFGDAMDHGVELAVEEINQSGGIFGQKLAVVSCDDATSADQAALGAAHLVDVAKVDAIIGSGASGVTIEAFNRVAKPSQVLMVSPSATSPAISNLPDAGLLWRTAPSDAVQGRAIAQFIVEQDFNKIAIVNRNDAYGNGLADAIRASLCSSGFSCGQDTLLSRLYSDTQGPLQVDAQAGALLDVVNFKPDAVVLIAYVQDGVDFMNLAAGKGLKFILTDGTRDTDLLGKDPGQKGVSDPDILCTLVGTNPASPSGRLYDSFALKYEARFGAPPGTFAANSYDAAYLVAFAYAASRGAGIADPTGLALASGLARLSAGGPVELGVNDFGKALTALGSSASASIDIAGVSGPLDFDTNGEAASGIEMWRLDVDRSQIANLGLVYDGTGAYDFKTVLQSQPLGALCTP
jgi:branched-chain amino acid transport system substrate-binding protein